MKAIALLLLICFVPSIFAVCSSYDHNAFFYKMCANTNTVVKSLTVSPSPIVLGDNISISFSAVLGTTVKEGGTPFSVSLEVYKDEVFWVNLCDFVNCTVEDICLLLKEKVTPETCSVLSQQKLPCGCPINAGDFAGNSLNIKTHNPNVSWLTNGEYCAAATLSGPNGVVACVEVYAQLSSSADGKTLIHIKQ